MRNITLTLVILVGWCAGCAGAEQASVMQVGSQNLRCPRSELESTLSLPRSQAAAIIEYRTKHGDFKSIADLKRVPGIDAAKIEAKKDRLTF